MPFNASNFSQSKNSQYVPACFVGDKIATENYLRTKQPSFSFEEKMENPTFHEIIRPTLEGRDPSPFARRLSEVSNFSSYERNHNFNQSTPLDSQDPTSERRPSLTIEKMVANPPFNSATAPSFQGRFTNPFCRKPSEVVEFAYSPSPLERRPSLNNEPAPSHGRSRFDSVSSMNSDSTFFIEGNLHPRGYTPGQEDWNTDHEQVWEMTIPEEQDEGDETEVEELYRQKTPLAPNIRAPSVQLAAPSLPGSHMLIHNLRERKPKATSTRTQWICEACSKTYVRKHAADAHIQDNPHHRLIQK